MKNKKGVTMITVIVMVVIIAILATFCIVSGVDVINEAKEQAKEKNLTDVKILVGKEHAKYATAGVMTPANLNHFGLENVEITGIEHNSNDGTPSGEIKKIGENWFLLDEDTLVEMGVEFANETYVVNYKYNVVIPLSTTENIHGEIAYYNELNR